MLRPILFIYPLLLLCLITGWDRVIHDNINHRTTLGIPASLEGQENFSILPSTPSWSFGKSFIRKVHEQLLSNGKKSEADEFIKITSELWGSILEYVPRWNQYVLWQEKEKKLDRFLELADIAGYPLKRGLILKGILWIEILREFFKLSQYSAMTIGGRYSNVVYFNTIASTSENQLFGRKFCDEFGLTLPSSHYDDNMINYTKELYVRFWLNKLVPDLQQDVFGTQIFESASNWARVMMAMEGSFFSSKKGVLQHFLSLLTPQERIDSDLSHSYIPKDHKNPEEVQHWILEVLEMGYEDALPLLTYSKARERLKQNFQKLTYGTPIIFAFHQGQLSSNQISLADLLKTEGMEPVDVGFLWKKAIVGTHTVDHFRSFCKKVMDEFWWANKEGIEELFFYNLVIPPYDVNELARLVVEQFEKLKKEKSISLPKRIGILLYTDTAEFAEFIDYFSKRTEPQFSTPVVPVDLKSGDIIELHSPFKYLQRCIFFGKSDSNSIQLLPIHYWSNDFIGFLGSKYYLQEGYKTEPIKLSLDELSRLGLTLKKEPIQTDDYPIKIGEKFIMPYHDTYYNATVVGIAHRHFILVFETTVSTSEDALGGYALYIPIGTAQELLTEGRWIRINEWNVTQRQLIQGDSQSQLNKSL